MLRDQFPFHPFHVLWIKIIKISVHVVVNGNRKYLSSSTLEKNGFYPRREDIEAILRRMDHDANRQISYDEFCELACVQEKPLRQNEQ